MSTFATICFVLRGFGNAFVISYELILFLDCRNFINFSYPRIAAAVQAIYDGVLHCVYLYASMLLVVHVHSFDPNY